MRTLIIEDNSFWQTKLQIASEECNLEVIETARNLIDAKSFFEHQTTDLIIADIELNKEIIFDLFKDKKIMAIPTIFVTISEKKEYYEMAKAIKNHFFIVKPFHTLTLQSAIDSLFANHLENSNKTENEKHVIKNQFNEIFKVLSDTKLLDKFNIGDRETVVIFERMQQNKSFREIGEKNGYSAEVSRKLFYRGLNKLKSKIKNAGERYINFLEFTKLKKNKLEITTTLTNLNLPKKSITKEDILKNNIDELELLGTKWKNILHEKGIHYVEDLVKLNKKQILLFPNFGQLAVSNIELELSKYGLELKK
jgi:response regulator of citrate/malate metabolism